LAGSFYAAGPDERKDFFGEAKKKRSPRQAIEKCEAKSFYDKINLVHPSIAVR